MTLAWDVLHTLTKRVSHQPQGFNLSHNVTEVDKTQTCCKSGSVVCYFVLRFLFRGKLLQTEMGKESRGKPWRLITVAWCWCLPADKQLFLSSLLWEFAFLCQCSLCLSLSAYDYTFCSSPSLFIFIHTHTLFLPSQTSYIDFLSLSITPPPPSWSCSHEWGRPAGGEKWDQTQTHQKGRRPEWNCQTTHTFQITHTPQIKHTSNNMHTKTHTHTKTHFSSTHKSKTLGIFLLIPSPTFSS